VDGEQFLEFFLGSRVVQVGYQHSAVSHCYLPCRFIRISAQCAIGGGAKPPTN
jgi:hypothetical protein